MLTYISVGQHFVAQKSCICFYRISDVARVVRGGPFRAARLGTMGVGRGQRAHAPWAFIHDTDKVEGGLIELIFSLVFPLSPLEIFLPMPFLGTAFFGVITCYIFLQCLLY